MGRSFFLNSRKAEPPSLAIPWTECPAKSQDGKLVGKGLLRHSLETIAVARLLFKYLSPQAATLLPESVEFIVGIHDSGKLSPGFLMKYFRDWLMEKLPGISPDGFTGNHAEISEAAAKAFLGGDAWAVPIICGFHHGRRQANPFPDSCGAYGGAAWASERQRFIKRIASETGVPQSPLSPNQAALTAGLLCVADWIASDVSLFPEIGIVRGAATDLAGDAEAALAACGWSQPEYKQGLSFKDIFGYEPYPVQLFMPEAIAKPGLYVLEAPMGCGKTEAALYAAYRLMSSGANRGLYFALPTKVTSDKIHVRVQAFLKKICISAEQARLAHGSAWLKRGGAEEFSPGGNWFLPSKRALLEPFGVGTIDQALLGVLNVKHYFVRLAALAGKVVVFDEVHSYDLYTGSLLDSLCKTLLELKATVIILSATLTAGRRSQLLGRQELLAAYPAAFSSGPKGAALPLPAPKKSVSISLTRRLCEPRALASEAVSKAGDGLCVLIIANTVDLAQEIFGQVKSVLRDGEAQAGLLHSRFPSYKRERLEDYWIASLGANGARPRACVLVSTQIVEQSVDIDADLLFTEIAPTDMLLQRLGRLWRHQRRRNLARPHATLFSGPLTEAVSRESFLSAAGSSARVYSPYALWRSAMLWRRDEIVLPDEIRSLLEETYADLPSDAPDFAREFHAEMLRKEAELRATARTMEADPMSPHSLFSPLEDNDEARTRWGSTPQTQTLLLRSASRNANGSWLMTPLEGAAFSLPARNLPFDTLKTIHGNIVQIQSYRLPQDLDSNGDLLSFAVSSSRRAVLVVDQTGALLTLAGSDSGLGYSDELGVHARRYSANANKGDLQYELEW